MAVTVSGTLITFNDATTQGTAYIGNEAEVFSASGTFTVPAGITAVKVTVVGGGGGGGSGVANTSSGGGGGGGGVAVEWITGLTPAGTVTVTVGAGGASATAGGTSSFGAYCSATGGAAGVNSNGGTASGGAGGVGSGGTYNRSGGGGCAGTLGCLCIDSQGGFGGGSGSEIGVINIYPFFGFPYGGAGYISGTGGNRTNASGVNTVGNAATGFGNGGGGAKRISAAVAGGAGSAGIVIVEY